jgi:hypothetical protein
MSDEVPHFRLLGTPGLDQFGLRVVRYQYPGNQRPGGSDSNWLMIRGEVVREDRRWHFIDPCLDTDELTRLIAWLKRLPDSGGPIWFTEPLLQYEQVEGDVPWQVRVTLKGEALPDVLGLSDEERWYDGVRLDLDTTPEQVQRVIAGLEEDLARFPRR